MIAPKSQNPAIYALLSDEFYEVRSTSWLLGTKVSGLDRKKHSN
jgi:hypothetical protein